MNRLARPGRFVAYLVTAGRTVPVFPRSKRSRLFRSIESAEARLERVWSKKSTAARGLVYSSDGSLVWTIAL